MINIFQPSLGEEELSLVKDVFASNWIGMGNYVKEFEKAFANHLKAYPDNFLSTTSCSEGIFLSAYLFSFTIDDEIIAPAISFMAVGSSVLMSNAKIVLCDVDKRTCNTTAELIEKKITSKTKAIILNHYGGYPCDMDPIMELCKTHGVIVIEDSACATKSFYKGQACGTIGDMGLWSFGPTKIICTGDGGMIYLKSHELVEIAKERLYHGLPARQKSGTDSASSGKNDWWEIQINRFGNRSIMNNIAGALGVAQLKKLDAFLERRKYIFDCYMSEFSKQSWLSLPLRINDDCTSSYYFYFVSLKKRDHLARFLLEHDIYSTFRYWPLHKINYFKIDKQQLPNSDYISNNMLNLPLHQSLSDDDVSKVIDTVKKFGKLQY
jgi:dTDP-4-amino-4,6-dideoxygalactose transaminase